MSTLTSIILSEKHTMPHSWLFWYLAGIYCYFLLDFPFAFLDLFIHVCTLDLFNFEFIPLLNPGRKIMLEIILFLICIVLKILQPGLAGINLGKFLIKRVVKLVKREMPHISVSILPILWSCLNLKGGTKWNLLLHGIWRHVTFYLTSILSFFNSWFN